MGNQQITCQFKEPEDQSEDINLRFEKSIEYIPNNKEVGALDQKIKNLMKDPMTPDLIMPPTVSKGTLLPLYTSYQKNENMFPDKDIERIIQKIVSSKDGGSVELLSQNHQELLRLANKSVKRQQSSISIPLIMDPLPMYADHQSLKIILKILKFISLKDQVLLLSHSPLNGLYGDEVIPDYMYRFTRERYHLSRISYKYNDLEKFSSRFSVYRGYKSLESEEAFFLNQLVNLEENRNCEFKEVQGSNPVDTIKKISDQYVVAFLNLQDREEGSIYWGKSEITIVLLSG